MPHPEQSSECFPGADYLLPRQVRCFRPGNVYTREINISAPMQLFIPCVATVVPATHAAVMLMALNSMNCCVAIYHCQILQPNAPLLHILQCNLPFTDTTNTCTYQPPKTKQYLCPWLPYTTNNPEQVWITLSRCSVHVYILHNITMHFHISLSLSLIV